MTTSFSGVRLGKAAAALLTLSISLVVHADQACDAAFNNSSAKASCDLRHTRQYEPGACEITADCKKNIGFGMVTNNVIHRKLDSVKDLSNTDGLLRGGVEATPPKPANEASTASTGKVTVSNCKDAWEKSSAADTCVDLNFAVSGDVCTISVICAGTGGSSNRQAVDVIYSSVPQLTNQNGTLTGGKRMSNP